MPKMASYLPVLLATVSSNANDDSAVTTLPRGQVDYLSHDWQEEDVWRSWRNMTRQKNEIANGMRLENASWRTWWKQRNNLKTISPETLNWLKDSDVTWLYGPLHTAAEWTPPPRKSTVTPNDHLDLSQPKHKPILKYRNLSEFLTSDLPHSPLWSPHESDDEDDTDYDSLAGGRPSLPQVKSDTHIARWGPNRAFRKDSPPRIDPPQSALKSAHAYSGTNLKGFFESHIQPPSQTSPSAQASPSARSSSPEQAPNTPSPPITDATTPTLYQKKKARHITFNTFVEQCIAIDKPKSRSNSKVRDGWDGRTSTAGVNWDVNFQETDDDEVEELGDEQGYDEDIESSDDGDWKRSTDADNEFAICTDSEDSDVDASYNPSAENDSDEDDSGIVEMRSSRRPSASAPRSRSKSSNSSTSTSSTSDSGSKKRTYTASRRRNSSSASTLRPSSKAISSSSSGSSSTASLAHLTSAPAVTSIAPIAPTTLKVGRGDSWDGFGIHQHSNKAIQWMDGFGDDSWSDDGYVGFGVDSLELVYVPKAATDGEAEATFQHRGAYFSIGDADTEMDLGYGEDYFGGSHLTRTRRHEPIEDPNNGSQEERVEIVHLSPPLASSPTPVSSPKHNRPALVSVPAAPPTMPQTSTAPPAPTSSALPTPPASASIPVNIPKATRPTSPPQPVVPPSSSSSSLLSPRARGRSAEQIGESPRGRSLTRTPSWTSDCERSRSMGGSSASPMGSLSPDGTGSIGAVASSVYAGRADQKHKRRRRDATCSSSGSSVSPDAGSSSSTPTTATTDAFGITEEAREPPLTSPTPANSPADRQLAAHPMVSSPTRAPPVESSHVTTARTTPGAYAPVNPNDSIEENPSLMGRMVNTAGSYFGLWN